MEIFIIFISVVGFLMGLSSLLINAINGERYEQIKDKQEEDDFYAGWDGKKVTRGELEQVSETLEKKLTQSMEYLMDYLKVEIVSTPSKVELKKIKKHGRK